MGLYCKSWSQPVRMGFHLQTFPPKLYDHVDSCSCNETRFWGQKPMQQKVHCNMQWQTEVLFLFKNVDIILNTIFHVIHYEHNSEELMADTKPVMQLILVKGKHLYS